MKPRIFISSTFYDLKYIREELSNYVKAHDFEPIMFEDGDIGYKPGKELDESCYDAMRSADMVILIIGGEYGSPASKKDRFGEYVSVTRNEFRIAVKRGIPVFCMIDSKVFGEYDIYEMNSKLADEGGLSFKNTKNINVFRFIKEIKNIGNIPIQEFEKVSDIKDFLGKQWSDMFKEYLYILKEKSETKKLENMLSDMNNLVAQMNVMVEGIGKKVIDNDDSSYDIIKQTQEKVEAEKIALDIAQYVVLDETASAISRIPCIYVFVKKLWEYFNIVSNGVKDINSILDRFSYDMRTEGVVILRINMELFKLPERYKSINESPEIKSLVTDFLCKNETIWFIPAI